MIYALEFYWVDEAGRQEQLTRQQETADSLESLEARARATLRNVLLDGRRSNLCLIKDLRGRTLRAVVDAPKAARKREARQAFAKSGGLDRLAERKKATTLFSGKGG